MDRAERPVPRECIEGYVFTERPFRLLILRRPPDRGGYWVPVSGKVEPSDAGFPAALRRELSEETGFPAPERVFSLDWIVGFEGPDGGPWRLHAYAIELAAPLPPQLGPEHAAFEWTDAATAIARLHFQDNRDAVRRLVGWRVSGRSVSQPNV